MMGIKMLPEETPGAFIRRRNSAVKDVCEEMGWLSKRHAKRILDWKDHIARPRNAHSWPAALYDYRGSQWLMERRAERNSGLFGGRTGTRVAAGRVAVRWHDGVRFAQGC